MVSTEELLRPSLDARDDAVGIERPWDPDMLWWLMLLLGPLGGGLLLALNERRLGMRGRAPWMLALFALVQVGLIAGLQAMHVKSASEGAGRPTWTRFLAGLVALALGAFFVRAQRRRFRAFAAIDGKAASLWVPGVLAFLLQVGVALAVGSVLAVLAPGVFGRPR